MFNKISKLSPLVLVLLLTACSNDVTVTTTLNSTRDVEEGASVYLDEKVVGEVVDVDRAEGQTILKIELDEESRVAIKQNAAVVINRLKANAPIEIYNQKTEANSIQDGQELKGLDSMFQLGAWMVGDSLDMGADALTGYVSAFQKYLQGDNWQQDKAQITEQAQQVATAAEAVVKQAGEEVMKVTEDLKQVEGEVAAAVEQIGGDLAPVFGELAKSGQTIMQELEKLSSNLERQGDAEQAVGTQFMQSLEQALEALNDSMEHTLSESGIELESGLEAEQESKLEQQLELPSNPQLDPLGDTRTELIETELPMVSDSKIGVNEADAVLESGQGSNQSELGVQNPVTAPEAVVLPPVVPVESALIEVESEGVELTSDMAESSSVSSAASLLEQKAPEVQQGSQANVELIQQLEEVASDVVEKTNEVKQLAPPQTPEVLQ